MASRVFEEQREFDIEMLEATNEFRLRYPYPDLRQTGRFTKVTFPIAVLENDLLRVEICPDLGGRITSVLDRRTNTSVFPSETRFPCDRDFLGRPFLPSGIMLEVGQGPRPNAMGRVDYQLVEPDDPEESAGVLIGELIAGQGLSFHAMFSLPPDRAEICLEVRALNRTFGWRPFEVGVSMRQAEGPEPHGVGAVLTGKNSGIFVSGSPLLVNRHDGDQVLLGRVEPGFLAPRQPTSWNCCIAPFTGLAGRLAFGSDAGIGVNGSKVSILPVTSHRSATLRLFTESGSYDATVNLNPLQPLSVDTSQYGALAKVELAIESTGEVITLDLQTSGRDRASSTRSAAVALPSHASQFECLEEQLKALQFDELELEMATELPDVRVAALATRARRAVLAGDSKLAEKLLDRALMFNGEDPLLWWERGALTRDRSSEEESHATLNAHFLAPFEPILRAEGFLSQPADPQGRASPLVEHLADDPDSMVEAATLLVESGRFQDALKWIEACLKANAVPMLSYIAAWILKTTTKLDVDAAQYVMSVKDRPIEAPLPWRSCEWTILEDLLEWHPGDQRIKELLDYRTSASR